MKELIEPLRDYRERVIFQGGSKYALALADELEALYQFKELAFQAHPNIDLDIEYLAK